MNKGTTNNVSILNTKDGDVTLTWIQDKNVTKYSPFFQVYGLCFNTKGDLLVINEKGKWKIPGGTPENNETPEDTLIRELKEEADVTISKLVPLGVQRVDFPNNPNKKEGDLYYQYRYICLIDKELDRTPDPDNGLVHPRKFVTQKEQQEMINWGNAGNAMFEAAFKEFPNLI